MIEKYIASKNVTLLLSFGIVYIIFDLTINFIRYEPV